MQGIAGMDFAASLPTGENIVMAQLKDLEHAGELTIKQALFVEEYVRNGMNGAEAAQVAGYNGNRATLYNQARKLLQKPMVRKALKELTRKSMEAAEITVEKILADLELAKSEAMIPKMDAQGNMKRELGSFLKATELQGKYLKMFSDKVEISGSVSTVHDLSNVPSDVLERMLKLYEQAAPDSK
jgi:hypothetical protein